MSWSEQELRETFLASLAAAPGRDCPPPDAIWNALNLAQPPEQRYAIILHTASCRHCAQAWQAAKLIAEESGLGAGSSPEPKPHQDPWWRRWLTPAVLAPAMAGAAALFVALVWLGPTDPGPVAPPADSGIMRGLGNAPEPLIADGAELTLGEALAWRGLAGATQHRVVMYSTDGERRLELPAAERLPLGPEMIDTFGAGSTVYWYVVAVDGAEPAAQSEVRRFILIGAE